MQDDRPLQRASEIGRLEADLCPKPFTLGFLIPSTYFSKTLMFVSSTYSIATMRLRITNTVTITAIGATKSRNQCWGRSGDRLVMSYSSAFLLALCPLVL
jgi:hypothetical protein